MTAIAGEREKARRKKGTSSFPLCYARPESGPLEGAFFSAAAAAAGAVKMVRLRSPIGGERGESGGASSALPYET